MQTSRLLIGFGIALTLAVAGVLGDEDAEPTEETLRRGDCFFIRSIYRWRVLDNENMVVHAPRSRPFHIKFAWNCPQLKFAQTLAFQDGNRDNRICGYGGDTIRTIDSFPQSCPIDSVTELSETALQALLVEHGKAEGEIFEPDEPEVEILEEDQPEESGQGDSN